MSEEQVVKLLEEIRDLQKLHVENYKDALKNQQESIELQRHAVRRQRIALLVLGTIVLAGIMVIIWTSHS